MTTVKATELIHLTYDGNFQLNTNAKVLLCRVIDDKSVENVKHNNSDEGNEQQEGRTVLVSVELQLDVTAMHPQGGGQPTDIGTITVEGSSDDNNAAAYSATISKVTIDRSTGIATHAGTISLPTANASSLESSDLFPPNTSVKVSVDPDNRLLLSECHTAGHVVDAAMARCDRMLPPTKGYHFLEGPYVEYEGKIDVKEREEFLGRLKVAFQELIDEDLPTNIQTLPIGEAESLCNLLAQNFNMKDYTSAEDPNPLVRVVTVAGVNCPCGGTHVRSTGALNERGWIVKGLKCKKGVVRVRYGPKE